MPRRVGPVLVILLPLARKGHALITHLGTGRSGIRWQGRWRRQSDSATAEVDLTSSNLGGPVGTAGGPADAASELAELREEFHL